MHMPEPILQVEDLRINYYTKSKLIEAVQGVRFTIYKNEVFGLVGESGCGKTTLAMGILQLVQAPGRIESGRIDFDGTDLLTASPEKFRSILWNEIAYIPQGAMSALNPVTRLRHQFLDVIHDAGRGTSLSECARYVSARIEWRYETAGLYCSGDGIAPETYHCR
jgi:ABC-type dipeptide/oligopeptide/nickel transport system ATPase component